MLAKYHDLEKKLITNKNRFDLNIKQKSELNQIFKNKNILICGAAGSIGEFFVLNCLKFNFKKLYLVDKNENGLAELNREIVLKNKNYEIDYICADINSFNLNYFLKKKKINLFMNFAALKHVRSEENNFTIKYLFETNSLKCFNFTPSKYLKKVFFISTDKACNP